MWDIISHIRRSFQYRSHYFIPGHQLIIQYITGHKGTRFEKLDILQIYFLMGLIFYHLFLQTVLYY